MKTETTTTTKRKKVIVISFDAEEQQAFFDIVSIKDGDDDIEDSAASRSVEKFRPYVNVVDILDVPALNKMLTAIYNVKGREVLPFAQSVNGLTREQCLELLYDDSATPSDFSTATLRELVRSGLEAATISEDSIPS